MMEEETSRKRKNSSADGNNSGEEDDVFLGLALGLNPASHSPVEQQQQQPETAPPTRPPSPSPPSPLLLSTVSSPLQSSTLSRELTPRFPVRLNSTRNRMNYRSARPISPLFRTVESLPRSPYRQRPASARSKRQRRNSSHSPPDGKSEIIPIPYPWATDRRARVHDLDTLLTRNISKISGQVQCRRCERQYQMDYDLRSKFLELRSFIEEKKDSMHQRAPEVWMNPLLPNCMFCNHENSVRPIISDKKKSINWLFLLLGQLLGCCKLEQLKYFCKYTRNHRTGAKDRVVYLTYLNLCKQLDPSGPFDI